MQSMIQKEWIIARPAPDEHLRRYKNISPILAQMLFNRGFEDPDQAKQFLTASDLTEDPFKMKDMHKAVTRIGAAIANQESIAVYGDFDADGVTATCLLVQALAALGADVQPYIPDRVEEGYGLNCPALEALAGAGVGLVVTVDCGIRSVNEVEAGLRAGLDIIITDHHSTGPEIPRATATINPQQKSCAGNTSLAGVGVAFMLAKALLLDRWQNDRDNYPDHLRLSDLLDLVAIGTVADLAALNDGENRRLVRHGLKTINEGRRPGLAALGRVARLRPGKICAADIGFMLGPRINAAGRLDSAMSAYNLLSASSEKIAEAYALELQSLNAQRQQLTRGAQAAISDQIGEIDGVDLIFAGDEKLLPGIVGLVAGRLTERFYRPAVVLEYGEEESRASCRSIPEFNITHALDECADLLIRHGGHAMAAGFTVHNSNLDALRRALERKAKGALEGQELRRRVQVDMEIDERDLRVDLADELMWLEPTGHANPPASFMSRNLGLVSCRRVGDDGRHLKLKIAREDKAPIDAIGFGLGEWSSQMPGAIDAAYHLEMNEWNGRRSMQLKLIDIRPAEGLAAT
ncbi:MAG: single-stranded-DNA-specific exonuclease RecJ [Chloroflexi bacterium]|nr:single-stranded-DNA-specific exonuclease RecJ [Chloroflexota bacterium]